MNNPFEMLASIGELQKALPVVVAELTELKSVMLAMAQENIRLLKLIEAHVRPSQFHDESVIAYKMIRANGHDKQFSNETDIM